MQGVFITGTSTGVGKTVVTAGLTLLLARKGLDVVACKPFASSDRPFSKRFNSEDTALLAKASGSAETDRVLNPSYYPLGASPYMASRVLGMKAPSLEIVCKSTLALAAKHDFAVVEGIGGIMVPITRRKTLADFVKRLGLPVIIVTTPFLGSLNHTLLTIMACRAYHIKILGIVVNMMPLRPSIVEREAPRCIEELSGIEVIATLQKKHRLDLAEVANSLQKAVKPGFLPVDQL